MRYLRSLSDVTLRDSIKSEEITKNWKVEEIIDDIKNCHLKWNQDVLRMPENRIPRKALQYWLQGKGDLGRPYRRWKHQFIYLQKGNFNQKLQMEEEEYNYVKRKNL